MQKTNDFQSEYNTETVKYTGPLSIVRYDGLRNSDDQMHGEGMILFANGSTYVGSFGNATFLSTSVLFYPLMCAVLMMLTENDMLCGFGVLSDPNSQSTYKGEFKGNLLNFML